MYNSHISSKKHKKQAASNKKNNGDKKNDSNSSSNNSNNNMMKVELPRDIINDMVQVVTQAGYEGVSSKEFTTAKFPGLGECLTIGGETFTSDQNIITCLSHRIEKGKVDDGEERFFLRTHSPSKRKDKTKKMKETLSTDDDAGTATTAASAMMKREAPTNSDNDDNNTSSGSSSRKRAKSSKQPPPSIKRKQSSAKGRMKKLMELTAKQQSLQTNFPLGCQVIYNKTQSDSDEDEVVVSTGTVDTVYFDLSSTTIDPLYEIKEVKSSLEDYEQERSQERDDKVLFAQDSLAYALNCPIYYTETKHGEAAAADEEGRKEGVVLSHQWTWTDGDDHTTERLTYTLQLKHAEDSEKYIMKCNVSPEHVLLRSENPSEHEVVVVVVKNQKIKEEGEIISSLREQQHYG